MVLGLAGVIHRHAGGQVIRGPAIQEVRAPPPGCGRGHVRGEGDRLLALVVVEALGTHATWVTVARVERLTISPLAALR